MTIFTKSKICALALLLMPIAQADATISTAWYKVDKIQQILKLVDKKCKDDEVEKCQRTRHWRVYYKATSRTAPLQKFVETVSEDVPQLGAMMQITVDVKNKKKAAS
ncbi:hypothetical protein MHM98_06120 [Psychrobium sp. MM17-31]|uniref:hypothetical protein n=1 Tax=Psychrobium sp. MM17-31 TaxID=2917758 RepID=UPI001EF5BE74|nr:hypothetical protein [Psychrobium sp. MM17-31]MCG7530929.1 hypothetical protein [Psychrobium sp. MM17-31]